MMRWRWIGAGVTTAMLCMWSASPARAASGDYWVLASNERSGDVTIIDGPSRRVIDTFAVGKRPRGIHASPDGKFVYVALSGRPIEGPPKLDANGNPMLHEDDEDAEAHSDHSADGIGIIDVAAKKFLRKIPAGSDPEQFAVSPDGKTLYVANEDVSTASELRISDGKVRHIFRVGSEPEGVGVTPNARFVFITCETTGDVYSYDRQTHKEAGKVHVGGRPRSIVFTPDGERAFVPSESSQQLHVIDLSKMAEIKTIRLPEGRRPMGTAISRDGKRLYVSTGRGGSICIFDTNNLNLVKEIKIGGRPWGIALSPDELTLFAADGPTNAVAVIDLASEKKIAQIPAGRSPWGVTVVPAPSGI